ncbi:MAG: hypothetical protein ACMUIE_01995 [Thermoplasmatota archaeon]
MASAWETFTSIFLLISGITAILWFIVSMVYRMKVSRKEGIGLFEVELPEIINIWFWILLGMLVLSNILFYVF